MPIHDWTRIEAGIFHHFHHDWISELSKALNSGVLPPDYYALSEQVAGGLIPDVLALERIDGGDPGDEASGGIAVAPYPPRVRYMFSAEPEFHADKRYHVVIRHRSDDQIVAMIEIVSVGNKSSRNALRSFVDKSIELLKAGIHILIVDLFPPGRRDPRGIHAAIWEEICEEVFQPPADQTLTLASYNAGTTINAYVEPTATGKKLSDMPLFLSTEMYVLVPLETTYKAAYEAFPMRWRDVLERGDQV